MSGKKPLGFNQQLGFGKHSGKTVRQVASDEKDVGWLLWIRKEKHKQGEQMFDDAVNEFLDKAIKTNRKQWSKFAVGDMPMPGSMPIEGLTTQPDRSEAYDEKWGAF